MKSETDYLIVGCGASAMAFADVMLDETDATITIVDRRNAPGGHWNDVYPFVKLHQPSAFYGVASRALGRDRVNQSGFNNGFYELASGTEITNYFHEIMQDKFLPTGRVEYHPVSDYIGDGEFVSLLSGERHQVEIRKKLVDSTILDMQIPLTHKRKFEVADGVVCIPPNDLTRAAPDYEHFTILGAGKTAIDTIVWLLAHGAPPKRVSWVLPRDSWLFNRAYFQPGNAFFTETVGGIAQLFENVAAANSIEDLCLRMEATGHWLRLDTGIWPGMFHGATVSEGELEQLRRVPNMIRQGHVQRIELDKIYLDKGTVDCEPRTLYIDCTAKGLAPGSGNQTPVFSETKISLNMVRMYQPTFSAALIAHLESNVQDLATKQKMTQAVPMTDTAEDWVRGQVASMSNQYTWSQDNDLPTWLADCRLDLLSKMVRSAREDDTEKQAIISRLLENSGLALQNVQRLAATIPAKSG